MQQDLRQGAASNPVRCAAGAARFSARFSCFGSRRNGRDGAELWLVDCSAVPPGFTEARGDVDGSSTEMGADRHISLVA